VSADDPADAAAVREVDLQKKFHWSATDLAKKLDLTGPRATALRRHLQIDDDPTCIHHFDFGGMKLIRYSDNALTRMRETLDDPATDMAAIWAEHGFGRSGKK
jgi:prophage antirepressor-like protein